MDAKTQAEISAIVYKSETQSIKEDVKKYGKKKFIKDIIEYIEEKVSSQMQFILLMQVFKAMH